MRLIRACILVSLVAQTSLTFAQKLSPGYYVTTGGDTVKTHLALRQRGGRIIGVRTHENKLLGVQDVRAVHLDIFNYVVKTVRIDKSPRVLGDVLDTVFLEVMVHEKIALYYSVDEYDKTHYFVEDEDGMVEELGLRILDRGDGLNFQELPVYKQTLKALFPTCKDLLAGNIDKTRYTRNSIMSTFKELYECRYGALPYIETTRNFVHDFGMVIGLSLTKINFEGNSGALIDGLIFDRSTDLNGGIFMETRFARTGNLFSIRQELTHRKYDATSQDYNNGQGPTTVLGQITASYIKYNFMVKAAISHNTLRPFLGAGISPSVLLKESDRAVFMNNTSRTSYPLLKGYKSFEFGVFGSAGLMLNNFSVEARVERSGGLDPKNANSIVNTLYFLLSYRFIEGRH